MTSTVSVILLAIPALKSASENKVMLTCLLLGIAASITGMALRWWSHRVEQKDKDRIEREAKSGPPSPVPRSPARPASTA